MRLFILFIITGLCAYGESRPEVTVKMKQMFNSLMNLQPYLVSTPRYKDPKNKKVIEENLKALSSLKHAFPKKMQDEEPGVAAIASLFANYLQDAERRYKSGDFDYSRHRMRTVTSFCFNCHSRVSTSKSFLDIEKRVDNLGLSNFEKAEFYAATRQFDKALASYSEIFSGNPKNEMGLIEFTRALRHALALTVRVKKNAQATYDLIESVRKRTDLPEFVRGFCTQWKKDAEFWIKESAEEKGVLSGEEMVKRAKALTQRASTLQAFPADENGDISYLRATNYLHEALDKEPKAAYRAEALYLLGMAYSALQDPMLWDVDRIYFEACVREFPKTEMAKKCYRRYSDKVYLGYSGSGGTFIPEDELEKLVELRKLAE